MTIVDTNVLVYAVNASDPNHRPARRWLEAAMNGSAVVGLAWVVLLGFLRVATNPQALPSPLPLNRALSFVGALLTSRAAIVVQPTARHLGILAELVEQSGTAANLVTDAHLAALAREHGASITSFDRDFLRFPGIRLEVPPR